MTDRDIEEVTNIIRKHGVMPLSRDLQERAGITEYTLNKKIKPELKNCFNPIFGEYIGIPYLRDLKKLLKTRAKSQEKWVGRAAFPEDADSKKIQNLYYEPMMREIIDYLEEHEGRDVVYEELLASLGASNLLGK